MANIMMQMKLDKRALIILIADIFKYSNKYFFSSESTGVIGFTFGFIVKKLLAKKSDAIVNPTLLHICRSFFIDNFNSWSRKVILNTP